MTRQAEDILTRPRIDAALADLPDWRYRLGGLVTVYKAPTAAGSPRADRRRRAPGRRTEPSPGPGLALQQGVHPLSPPTTPVTEVTQRDVAAAAAAARAAAAPGPARNRGCTGPWKSCIDTTDPAEISEVWRAGPRLPQGPGTGDLRGPVRPRARAVVPGDRHAEREPSAISTSTGAMRNPGPSSRRPRRPGR